MTDNFPLPQAIIFDWDGVLVDTKDTIAQAYFYTFLSLKRPAPSIETLHQLPGTSLRDYFPKIFGEEAAAAERFFYAHILENHLKSLKTMEGAEILLKYLRKRKLPCSVLSNKRGDILRQEVAFLGWEKFFHKVVGSKDYAEDKPSVVPTLEALKGIDVSIGKHIWMIGDWLSDLECAQRANLFPVLINNPTLRDQKDLPYGFELYINDCRELKKLLIRL